MTDDTLLVDNRPEDAEAEAAFGQRIDRHDQVADEQLGAAEHVFVSQEERRGAYAGLDHQIERARGGKDSVVFAGEDEQAGGRMQRAAAHLRPEAATQRQVEVEVAAKERVARAEASLGEEFRQGRLHPGVPGRSVGVKKADEGRLHGEVETAPGLPSPAQIATDAGPHFKDDRSHGAIFGRQLGFPPKDIDSLALSCSMMDIGKSNLPPELLRQAESPTEEQWQILQSHVQEGLNLLEENKVDDEMLRLTIQCHHERYDGSGYPNGLTGNDIPLYARIAGIVDSYDAMISDTPYSQVRSSYSAVQELQAKAGVLYQKELVEQFIQAIGVFPVGVIVEFNTGEVGVVVAQDSTRRLKPKIILLLDSDKKPRSHLVIVDLANQAANDSGTLFWWITKELPNSAYGIDPAKYFL